MKRRGVVGVLAHFNYHHPPTHHQQQAAGVSAMAGACFAMVAGGLGERLGYNGIKVFEFPKPRHYDLLGLLGLLGLEFYSHYS